LHIISHLEPFIATFIFDRAMKEGETQSFLDATVTLNCAVEKLQFAYFALYRYAWWTKRRCKSD